MGDFVLEPYYYILKKEKSGHISFTKLRISTHTLQIEKIGRVRSVTLSSRVGGALLCTL